LEQPHACVDLAAVDIAAAEPYFGIAAPPAGCEPCWEDFAGLLAAVVGSAH
jgi:hypothetical protein